METKIKRHIDLLVKRYPILDDVKSSIIDAYFILENAYQNGQKLLIAGNGGSASDSEHIVGELMKGFLKKRSLSESQKIVLKSVDEKMGDVLSNNLQGALPAISLTAFSALSTAYMNDCLPELVFAQQVNGLGCRNDVFMGITTSGNSKNIVYAAIVAKANGLKVIGLTGDKDSRMSEISDVCIRVPEIETYKVQELHLPVYHCLCMMLEERFFEF